MSRFQDHVCRNFAQDHGTGVCVTDGGGYCPCPLVETSERLADLVCSDDPYRPGLHRPLIDFDLPVTLFPSGTPGNSHLYIDKAVSFEHYLGILKAFAEAGIVQWGYYDATKKRGYGSLRHPNRPKPIGEPF